MSQKKSTWERVKVFGGLSPRELAPLPPNVAEPRTGLSMGQHCELMAQNFEIPRQDQDQLAFESHIKAAEAYNSGFMDDLLVPCAGVYRDNNLREDIDLEKLGTLRTAFEKSERGDADRGKLDAVDRRGCGRVACLGRMGAFAWLADPGLSHTLSNSCEQFRCG